MQINKTSVPRTPADTHTHSGKKYTHINKWEHRVSSMSIKHTEKQKCGAVIEQRFKGTMQLHIEAIATFAIRVLSLGARVMVRLSVPLTTDTMSHVAQLIL